LKPHRIAEQIVEAAALGDFHALHPVSARDGDGLEPLRADLAALLPDGPRYFGAGDRTDLPLEARIAEIVREKALELTRDEGPHAISVEVQELDGGAGRIRAQIWGGGGARGGGGAVSAPRSGWRRSHRRESSSGRAGL